MAGYDGRGGNYPLTIPRDADFAITVTATDSLDAAIDLSAATITGEIYDATDAVAVTMTDAVSGAGSNVITLSLTDVQTAALTAARYNWTLWVERGGDRRPWLAGRVTMTKGSDGQGSSSGSSVALTVDSDVNVAVTVAIVGGGASDVETLTNKTLTSFTNTISADEIHIQVRNSSGSTITKGTPVYPSGYNVGQDLIEVEPADASSTATMQAIGIVDVESIANSATGSIIVSGRITDVDTSAYTAGDLLFVASGGGLTNVAPTGTAQLQEIGEVLRSNVNNGVILVSLSETNLTGFAHDLVSQGTAADARTALGISATNTPLTDTAGNYTSADVEGALAELPGQYAPVADKVGTERFDVNYGASRRGDLWPDLGFHLLDPVQASGTTLVTLSKGKPYVKTFVAPADMVVTGISMASTGTVSAGLTLARFCLFHVGTRHTQSDYTEAHYGLLAQTANDTTLFNSANTLYTRSFDTTGGFPSAVRLVKGQRYAAGYMIAGTTAPTVVSAPAFTRPQIVGNTILPMGGGVTLGVGFAYDTITDVSVVAACGGVNVGYDGAASAVWAHLTCDHDSTLAPPLRTVVLGDSYVSSYGGWFYLANAQAGARLLPVLNAGTGGETTTQILARIQPVIDANPDVVVLSGGINDVAATVSAATVNANILAIANAVTAAGAKIIICTLPPSSFMDAGELVTLAAVNAYITSLDNGSTIFVAQTGTTLSTGDGVTFDVTKYVADGGSVHPNTAGRQAMADVLDDAIAACVATF